MALFTGGPSVRVSANSTIEFKWITDVAWFGKVEIFTSRDGTGTPILIQKAVDAAGTSIVATQQTVSVSVAGPISPDTSLFFKVTATDPNRLNPDLVTPTPLPPFFTGTQALSNLSVASITSSGATVAWSANVIGFGKVVFGTAGATAQDANNITDHAIDLANLSPGTTYSYTATNKHAIDGDDLASASGQFSTPVVAAAFGFAEPHAEPRVIQVGQASSVSIRAKDQGNPVAGATVGFAIDPSSVGAGTLSAGQASTDANGIATVQVTGTKSGLVNVVVTSTNARNSPFTIPVVVK